VAKATVHMICGFVGAGKTTLARSIERETGGVRFSIDEWMITLYGHHMSRAEFSRREANCKSVIWQLCRRLLSLGIDVILDCGFWKRAERDEYRRLATEAGCRSRLYFLDVPEGELQERLRERNRDLPDGDFPITEEMFEMFKPWFEPPGEDEDFERV
jgi:predicted kinase